MPKGIYSSINSRRILNLLTQGHFTWAALTHRSLAPTKTTCPSKFVKFSRIGRLHKNSHGLVVFTQAHHGLTLCPPEYLQVQECKKPLVHQEHNPSPKHQVKHPFLTDHTRLNSRSKLLTKN